MRPCWRAALLLPLALLAAVATAAPPRLVGYVTARADPAHIEAGRVTDLIFAFARIDHGRVVLPPAQVPALQRLLALRHRHPGLRVLLSVGGWKARGFSDAALNRASRQRFVDSAVALVQRLHADGLDIDWEYPGRSDSGIVARATDREHFTALLAALRRGLDRSGCNDPLRPRHLLLTAALADGPFVSGVDLHAVQRSLDWVNLMTYDFNNAMTATTGHHTGLFVSRASHSRHDRTVARAVRQYLAAGVPARKLVIGAAFYGRAFGDVRDREHGRYQPFGHFIGTVPWPQLRARYIGDRGFVRYWDAAAQAPYLWNARRRIFVSYDDARSLRAKVAYVRRRHLGGVMYWAQGLDPSNSLFDVLAGALHSHPRAVTAAAPRCPAPR